MTAESTLRKAKKLEKMGQVDQAIVVCETFLQKFPKNGRIRQHVKRLKFPDFAGTTLPAAQVEQLNRAFKAGDCAALVPKITQLIGFFPTSYFLWNLLGNAHLKLDAPDKAEKAFLRAVELDPKVSNAFVGLGDVYKIKQQPKAAISHYRKALDRQPGNLTALNNLGNALAAAGQFDDAAKVLSKAHELAPNNAVILFNLSSIYRSLTHMDQAEDALQKALALAPAFTEAHYNLGLVQSLQGKLPQAVDSFDAALLIDPTHDQARAEKLHQKAHMCDWSGLAEFAELPADFGARDPGTSPFPFLALQDHPVHQRRRSQTYAKRFEQVMDVAAPVVTAREGRRLKIGYFSADFHNHATMHLMGGLFDHHTPEHFEIIAYSFGPNAEDHARKRLLSHTDRFYEVGHLSAAEIAQSACEDGLDIAIDLKGYTGDSRPEIFAHRPAPIQISWLGYPGSMGSDAYDYVIADRVVLPEVHRDGYSEKVIYMPSSYQVNDNKRTISARPFTRQDCGLPENGFVFCCFNNNYKITPVEFDIWMRLLSGLEGSVLWLLGSNSWSQENLRQAAAQRGVCPSRLVFAERMEVADHLARHRLADLFLDTFICNAHTTASDALWAGLPIVTNAGDQFAARVCASLLHAAGLPELITTNAADYETLADRLARNPDQLAAFRDRLARNRDTCPLFDTVQFTRDFETALLKTHDIALAGLPPQDFHVTPKAHLAPNA